MTLTSELQTLVFSATHHLLYRNICAKSIYAILSYSLTPLNVPFKKNLSMQDGVIARTQQNVRLFYL